MIKLAHLCDLHVELDKPLEMGDALKGRRRIIPITGGADWQTIYANGTAELDARYSIETHDGAIIDVRNFGYRHGPAEVIAALARGEEVDPSLYYMRTQPRFETGDERYLWLNHTIAVGSGAREQVAVKLSFYEVR